MSFQAILDYWDSLEDQGEPQLSSKEFKKRKKKVKTGIKLEDNQEYWQGYEKGLNRRFLGSMLGPEKKHQGRLKGVEKLSGRFFKGRIGQWWKK